MTFCRDNIIDLQTLDIFKKRMIPLCQDINVVLIWNKIYLIINGLVFGPTNQTINSNLAQIVIDPIY